MLFPALCSGATTHILICLVCFPCILLPVPSWACWRPPCCRPRTDHPTRYNPAPFSLSASCTWAPAPAAPLFTLSLSQLQISRERMWNDHGNQTSQKFPLLFCTLYFPISYWSNLFFLLSFPFQTMKEPFQFMGVFFFFFKWRRVYRPLCLQKWKTTQVHTVSGDNVAPTLNISSFLSCSVCRRVLFWLNWAQTSVSFSRRCDFLKMSERDYLKSPEILTFSLLWAVWTYSPWGTNMTERIYVHSSVYKSYFLYHLKFPLTLK